MLTASLMSSKAQPQSARKFNPSSAGGEPREDSDCVAPKMTRLLSKSSSTIVKGTDQLGKSNHCILLDVDAVNFSLSLGINKLA